MVDPNKFRNKYRITTTRKSGYDYSSFGSYFITICIKNRVCCLGEINNHKMNLSEWGEIVSKYWIEIPKHFKHVTLGAFVVMPNHVHGYGG
jgi:putative transposase